MDLDGRLLDYGARIIKLVEALPKTVAGRRIGDQLLRCGTSVGANFEEAQRGMVIPEMEWIDISRGAGTDREKTDNQGVVIGPVTDEHHIRGYFQEWTRLMTGATTGWSERRGSADEH